MFADEDKKEMIIFLVRHPEGRHPEDRRLEDRRLEDPRLEGRRPDAFRHGPEA